MRRHRPFRHCSSGVCLCVCKYTCSCAYVCMCLCVREGRPSRLRTLYVCVSPPSTCVCVSLCVSVRVKIIAEACLRGDAIVLQATPCLAYSRRHRGKHDVKNTMALPVFRRCLTQVCMCVCAYLFSSGAYLFLAGFSKKGFPISNGCHTLYPVPSR